MLVNYESKSIEALKLKLIIARILSYWPHPFLIQQLTTDKRDIKINEIQALQVQVNLE